MLGSSCHKYWLRTHARKRSASLRRLLETLENVQKLHNVQLCESMVTFGRHEMTELEVVGSYIKWAATAESV
jgi:hypothetical protein